MATETASREPKLLTLSELAKALGTNRKTVAAARDQGIIRPYPIGRGMYDLSTVKEQLKAASEVK